MYQTGKWDKRLGGRRERKERPLATMLTKRERGAEGICTISEWAFAPKAPLASPYCVTVADVSCSTSRRSS